MRTTRRNYLSAIALVTVSVCARGARAEDLRLHFGAGAAHAVGDRQQTEFGGGGGGALTGEVGVGKVVGFELELSAIALAAGDAPGARAASPSLGIGLESMLGARVHPFGAAAPAGLYVAAHGGVAYTGNVARPGIDGQLGYDWRIDGSGQWELGPFIGFTEILETSSAIVPDAAQIFWVGAQISLGAPEKKAAPARQEETLAAAPSAPAPPSDRDHDEIVDAEDACPDVPGRRSSDPRVNGCPRLDRDNDTVFDDEDACPDVPGIRTDSPSTNGCPAPRNQVRLAGSMIMLGEIIHFEVDSPRVRRASWGIVKNVADFLAANPDIRQIDVEGHADEIGPDDYNLALSEARAEAVKSLLLKYGLPSERVTTHAFGETRPRALGLAAESLRQNRRVEFVVTRASANSQRSSAASDPSTSALNTGVQK